MRLRLYLDEDVIPELARALRRHGEDVVSAHEIGTTGWDDEAHLARATSEGRTILTYNYVDFLRIAAEWFAAGRPHAGIIISHHQYSRAELGEVTRTVLAALDVLDSEVIVGSVQVLDQYCSR